MYGDFGNVKLMTVFGSKGKEACLFLNQMYSLNCMLLKNLKNISESPNPRVGFSYFGIKLTDVTDRYFKT